MTDQVEIDSRLVLRIKDWGLGMFDDDDLRCEIVGPNEIWLMNGHQPVSIVLEYFPADHARCIGHLLIAAADAAERQGRDDAE